MEKRNANKQLDSLLAYVATVVCACLILMWSVFNAWLNLLQYRASIAQEADVVRELGDAGPAWGVTGLMVLLTCVIPFLLGLFLLFKTINRASKKPA